MSTTETHQEEHADGIVEDREKAPPVYFNILFYGLIIWGVIFMSFYIQRLTDQLRRVSENSSINSLLPPNGGEKPYGNEPLQNFSELLKKREA